MSSKNHCLVLGKAIYNSETQALMAENAILIQEDKISQIGFYQDLLTKYPNTDRFDFSDCYLFPGLINTHVHFEFDASPVPLETFKKENDTIRLVRAVENARIMLRSGVTTVRDAGSTWGMLDMLKIKADGFIKLPRLQLAGPPFTVTGGHLNFLGEEHDSTDELIKSVRLHQKRGCGAIKLIITGGQMTPGSGPERTSYSVEQIKAVVDEAHHLGLLTFAHCLTTQGLLNAVEGKVDCIEHAACFVRDENNGLLARVYEDAVMEQIRGNTHYFMNGLAAHYNKLNDCRSGLREPSLQEKFWLIQEQNMFGIFNKLCKFGFIPNLGTDAGVSHTYFDETWLELALMVERCGLKPAETINIATVNSAKSLGLGDVTGQLKEGFAADIIALSENPLDNVRAFSKVKHVICAGQLVNS